MPATSNLVTEKVFQGLIACFHIEKDQVLCGNSRKSHQKQPFLGILYQTLKLGLFSPDLYSLNAVNY